MAQWRAQYEQKLLLLSDEHKRRAPKFCQDLIQNRSAKTKLEEMKKSERDRIDKHLKELVAKMNIPKDEELTKKDLAKIEWNFVQSWKEWMAEVKEKYPLVLESDITHEIVNCIINKCQLTTHGPLIRSELLSCPLKQRGRHLKLHIDQERHLNFGFVNKVINYIPFTNLNHAAVAAAQTKTQKLLLIVQTYFTNKRDISYNDSHIVSIVRSLMKEIQDFEAEKQRDFSFTTEYRVDVVLEAAGYALRRFTQIQEEAIENHPVTYLNSLVYSITVIMNL